MKLILKYIKFNWFFSAVVSYMFLSCLLRIFTGINVTIPCLYTTIFGFHCPGCGLTAAFIELLKLNPVNAWNHNPLIFIVVPCAALYMILDLLRFNKRISKPAFSN